MTLEGIHVGIEPKVAVCGMPTNFRIMPKESSVQFPAGKYRLNVRNITAPGQSAEIEILSNDGSLSFTYCANTAGECRVDIAFPNGPSNRIGSIFIADTELAACQPMRGDFHIHTWYSDGRSSPLEIVKQAAVLGYDFIVVTDHNNYNGCLEARQAAKEIASPVLVLRGEEVTFERGHIVAVNTNGGVAILHDTPAEQERRQKILVEVSACGYGSDFPVRDLADGLWTARQIHAQGGLAILAHPFWIYNSEFHLDRRVAEHLLCDGEVDAVELIGDCEFEENRFSVNAYMDWVQKGAKVAVVGNSDTHGTAHTFGQYWTVLFAKEKSEAGIVEAIKARRCVACEQMPGERLRIYGPLPLVEYAYFLYR